MLTFITLGNPKVSGTWCSACPTSTGPVAERFLAPVSRMLAPTAQVDSDMFLRYTPEAIHTRDLDSLPGLILWLLIPYDTAVSHQFCRADFDFYRTPFFDWWDEIWYVPSTRKLSYGGGYLWWQTTGWLFLGLVQWSTELLAFTKNTSNCPIWRVCLIGPRLGRKSKISNSPTDERHFFHQGLQRTPRTTKTANEAEPPTRNHYSNKERSMFCICS